MLLGVLFQIVFTFYNLFFFIPCHNFKEKKLSSDT